MRRLAAILGLALALSACAGEDLPAVRSPSGGSPSGAVSRTPSPTATPSTSPSATPAPALPDDAPTELADPWTASELADAAFAPMLPPGAVTTVSEIGADPVEQIALAWLRGDDPFASEVGLVVWQRAEADAPWRAVYGFTDEPADGVLTVGLEAGDVTGDGVTDLLSREDTGGSGACATWRVIASAPGDVREIWRRRSCDTTVRIDDGRLALREAMYEPDDPHCCPSAFRYSTLEWDGEAFVRTSSEVVET